MEIKESIRAEVAENLIIKLDSYKGVRVYGADLAFKLFESYNIDGSITYSTHHAQMWIKAHFCELGDIVENMAAEWEYNAGADIFNNPEKFMVCVFLYVAEELLGNCESVSEFWNDQEELTDERIAAISADLQKEIAE